VNDTEENLPLRREKLTGLFIKVGRIQYILLGLIASGLFLFGKDFITKYWAGTEYEESYYVAMMLVLPASIALIQNIGIEVQRAQNKHKFRAIVYAFMAVSNVIMSIFLCQKYGAVGSALGTAISLVIANGIIMNIYYHMCCGIDVLQFWRNIMKVTRGLIIPVLFGLFITHCLPKINIWIYLGEIVVYVGVYSLSMWFIGIDQQEKMLIITLCSGIKKFGSKKSKNNS
jgi:O-antigen/teichoic acid export membrane protein